MKKKYLAIASLSLIVLSIILLLKFPIMRGTVEKEVIEDLDNPSLSPPKNKVFWKKIYLELTIDDDFTDISPNIIVRNNYTFTVYNVTIRAFCYRKQVGNMKPGDIEFWGWIDRFADRVEDFPTYVYAYGWIRNG